MSLKLLLIESNKFFEQNLGERFRREGFRLFCAQRLNDARKITMRKKIDVALIDLTGLRVEGIRIIGEIKKSIPLTEIITITNAEQMSLSIDVMKFGVFDDFLIPFDMNALTDRIKEAASRKKQNEGRKRSLFQAYQDHMVAAAFAEAGDPDTAKEFLEDKTSRRNIKKGEQDD